MHMDRMLDLADQMMQVEGVKASDCRLARTRIFQSAIKHLFSELFPKDTPEDELVRHVMLHWAYDLQHEAMAGLGYELGDGQALEDVAETSVPLLIMPFVLGDAPPELQGPSDFFLHEFGDLVNVLRQYGRDARFEDIPNDSRNDFVYAGRQFARAMLAHPFRACGCYDHFMTHMPTMIEEEQLKLWRGHPDDTRRFQYTVFYYAFYGRVYDPEEQARLAGDIVPRA